MKLRHHTVDVADNVEAFFAQFGKLALLIGTTKSFGGVPINLGLSLINGALNNRSYCIYTDDTGKPVAGLIWAHLDAENREFYLRHGVLLSNESWHSGRDLWLLNVIAPGGLIRDIFRDTMTTVFRDETEAFMLRPSPNGTRRIVRVTHQGTEVIKVLPPADSADAEQAATSQNH